MDIRLRAIDEAVPEHGHADVIPALAAHLLAAREVEHHPVTLAVAIVDFPEQPGQISSSFKHGSSMWTVAILLLMFVLENGARTRAI